MTLTKPRAVPPPALALAAAILFGATTPLAKLLLKGVGPVLLAGLFYLGSGMGLFLVRCVGGQRRILLAHEAPLRRQDLPALAGAILCGGLVAPVLLLLGLRETSAGTASLLLNLETALTVLFAWFLFGEPFDRRILLGVCCTVAGAVVLSWTGRGTGIPSWRGVSIVGACAAWALDNNLTRRISGGDPVQVAMIKGLVAGSVNLVLALSMGSKLPAAASVIGSFLVGLFGYGLSLVLFILALRGIGAARTSVYFSTAPFIGALIALAALREPLNPSLAIAGGLMALGIWLHVSERHEHEHRHAATEHDHRHVHDEHHAHAHAPETAPGEPHAHPHRHAPLLHAHPHFPDLHHRHDHR